METDIPLKALTAACAPDLLPLIGSPDATVLGVESLELPTMAMRLDNVLRLRSPSGIDYLHLVEWQGYRDPQFLDRALYYRAWLGLQWRIPIAATLIYLKPGDDTGDTTAYAGWARCVCDALPLRAVVGAGCCGGAGKRASWYWRCSLRSCAVRTKQ